MSAKVLHILSQRPGRTGSGVTLDAMIRQAAAAGWRQAAVIGIPDLETTPSVGGLLPDDVHPVRFATADSAHADLNYPVPGMSDVMPYTSTIWSTMSNDQLDRYRTVWQSHLAQVISEFAPDVIHSHHIWLLSSLIKSVAPRTPVITTCHSTGLRQMMLTPALAEEVRRGCARNDHFCVLREDHGTTLRRELDIDPARITVVGAGYRPELFHSHTPAPRRAKDLLYIGKYSHAKGLPWLLDAFTQLATEDADLRLHIAGDGAGPEAEALRTRMVSLAPRVILHGQLAQPQLADLMRRCGVCVLPSFYEGVPLVLVEAAACGCRLVSTALPGVLERIEPHLAAHLDLVPLPRLTGSDVPVAADLPRFVENLKTALMAAVARTTEPEPDTEVLMPLTWQAVFTRVENIWNRLTT